MSIYKVLFEKNKPVSAAIINSDRFDAMQIEQTNNKDEIKWMSVFASNEEKSIERANDIARQVVGLLHSSF